MVKSVLGVNHQGLTDWIIQRMSAVLMAVYSVGLLSFLICHQGLSFTEWHNLFSQVWMKVATILLVLALLFHAWVGMWTVFTDYVKPFVIRTILNFIVLLSLAACFVWALLILWSV